jgi:nucleoside-diphosphate-sugar epimerase
MLTQKSVNLGDPEPTRDFLYVSDHVEGYLTVLDNWKAVGETFNVCTGKGVTIGDLSVKLEKFTGFQGEIVWGTLPTRPLDIMCLIGDNRKAGDVLGWKPKVELDVGLEKTVKMLKDELNKLWVNSEHTREPHS